MTDRIPVDEPLVVLHGDEMAQIAFDRILEQFVKKHLNIPLVEIDLSAENRLLSNGQVVVDAIEALKQHGVGIKNAGMTVNRDQLDELLAKRDKLNAQVQTILDEATDPWGIQVERVEIKDIDLGEFGVILEGGATVTIGGEVVASLGPGDHFGTGAANPERDGHEGQIGEEKVERQTLCRQGGSVDHSKGGRYAGCGIGRVDY